MEVQKYIKERGLQSLTDELGITVKPYDLGYVKLNYSQIDSPKRHPVADECRGLVLFVDDEQNTSKVVCRSFNRFYNYGEGDTLNFDFSNCTVHEKVDGSLCLLWYSPLEKQWMVGTRGMAYAEGNFVFSLTEVGGTFKDWILRAMDLTFDELQAQMAHFPTEVTYVMEYIGPENKVVTHYTESQMVLLAVVDNETGKEEPIREYFKHFSRFMKIRLPNTFTAASGAELVAMADKLENLQEGFVVYDHNTGKRVKVKSSFYVAVHQLRGEGVPSQNRIMEVVLKNEQAELLTYFPEMQQFVDPVEAALQQLRNQAVALYTMHQDEVSQKDFALKVKDSKVAAICFKARKDNLGAWQAFEAMEIGQQMKILEKFL